MGAGLWCHQKGASLLAACSLALGLPGDRSSEIKDFPDPTVIGNEAPQISRYTLNLGAQYAGPISDTVDGLLRIDYRRTGKTWWEPFNTTVRNPVDIVDARAEERD